MVWVKNNLSNLKKILNCDFKNVDFDLKYLIINKTLY